MPQDKPCAPYIPGMVTIKFVGENLTYIGIYNKQEAITEALENAGLDVGVIHTTFSQPIKGAVVSFNYKKDSLTPAAVKYLQELRKQGMEVEGVPELAKIQV